jgi:putative endonuclease
VKEHFEGNGCRTTKGDPPVKLLYEEPFETYSEALKREARVKRWKKSKKESLIKETG